MCFGPEIMSVLSAVSTVTSVLGAFQQGQSQGDAYEYQAALAERDAANTRQTALNEKDAATSQAEKIRKLTRQQSGEATAALAASGVSVAEGTPIVIDKDIKDRGEQDAFTALLDGTRSARSLNMQADNQMIQAGMYKNSAKNARSSSLINAGGSLLAGASSFSSGWKKSPQATGNNIPGGPNTRIG